MVGEGLDFLHVSWKEVQRLCELLAKKILESGYKPKIIVAISRGGFPPARILCDLLDIRMLASVGIRYYSSINVTNAEPTIVFPLCVDTRGKKILIVDDVADKGQTLTVAKKTILKNKAVCVKVATLHFKLRSILRPDFYAQETEAWVVYPWETKETAKELVEKLESEGRNTSFILSELKKLGFNKKTIDDLL